MTSFLRKIMFFLIGLSCSWTLHAQSDSLALRTRSDSLLVDSIITRITNILAEVEYDPMMLFIDTSGYEHGFEWADDINLQIAASKGNCYEIIRQISKGADINNSIGSHVTPLHYAVASGKKEAIEILLLLGAKRNSRDVYGNTALISAVRNNDLEIAELLIRYGASIVEGDRNQSAAIHHAVINSNFYLADMLLYYETPLDLTDSEGNTPLMLSVWRGDYDIADILLKAGADANAKDKNGFTPFLMAAQRGDTLMMSILNSFSANIYASNSDGCNALCLASCYEHKDAVLYLLEKGKLWNPLMMNERNPVDIVTNRGNKEIASLLKEKGFKGTTGFLLEDISLTFGGMASTHYSLFSAGLALREPRQKAGLILGADFNPVKSRLLVSGNDDIIYQYRVKTTVLHAGIFKEFNLTNRLDLNLRAVTSISAGYRFHSYYSGTRQKPDDRFCIIPYAGIEWSRINLSIKAGLSYINTPFYKVSPVWLKLGLSLNFYKEGITGAGKRIKIYEN